MRWQEICEARAAHLFHGTNSASAMEILRSNAMKPYTSHRADELGYPSTNDDRVRGISFTRSLRYALGWRTGAGGSIVFAVDQPGLRNRFRLKPIDYFSSGSAERDSDTRSEAEEFCIAPNGITPLDRYLAAIVMYRTTYDALMAENDDGEFDVLLGHPLLRIEPR